MVIFEPRSVLNSPLKLFFGDRTFCTLHMAWEGQFCHPGREVSLDSDGRHSRGHRQVGGLSGWLVGERSSAVNSRVRVFSKVSFFQIFLRRFSTRFPYTFLEFEA